nr:hypothetical protein [uncultured bacterium]
MLISSPGFCRKLLPLQLSQTYLLRVGEEGVGNRQKHGLSVMLFELAKDALRVNTSRCGPILICLVNDQHGYRLRHLVKSRRWIRIRTDTCCCCWRCAGPRGRRTRVCCGKRFRFGVAGD